MSGLKSVIITLPKGLAKTPGILPSDSIKPLPKLNFTTSIITDKVKLNGRAMPKTLELSNNDGFLFNTETCSKGKKRRLDHLTWEEKLQRKKLKNRVAAQTSRDRKKAKLDELEDTVRSLREANELLTRECTMLRSQNEALMLETKRLRKDDDSKEEVKTKLLDMKDDRLCSMCQSRVDCGVPSTRSAVSLDPLQQGGTLFPTKSLTQKRTVQESSSAALLLKILTLYLLSRSYLTRSKEMITMKDSKSSSRVFLEKLPPKWKQALLQQIKACYSELQDGAEKELAKKTDQSERLVGPPPKDLATDADKCTSVIDRLQETPMELETIKKEPEVFSSYDESTNCITIVIPDEGQGDLRVQDYVEEIVGSDKTGEDMVYLMPDIGSCDSMSPASTRSEDVDMLSSKGDSSYYSDGGYESHDSPVHTDENIPNVLPLSELWPESFSELFPSLA